MYYQDCVIKYDLESIMTSGLMSKILKMTDEEISRHAIYGSPECRLPSENNLPVLASTVTRHEMNDQKKP